MYSHTSWKDRKTSVCNKSLCDLHGLNSDHCRWSSYCKNLKECCRLDEEKLMVVIRCNYFWLYTHVCDLLFQEICKKSASELYPTFHLHNSMDLYGCWNHHFLSCWQNPYCRRPHISNVHWAYCLRMLRQIGNTKFLLCSCNRSILYDLANDLLRHIHYFPCLLLEFYIPSRHYHGFDLHCLGY